ncbi:YebC/PmpR family DNA-binding transcriptional regulator [Venenivibrio stagnispumantis]|uniref:Probable transcriptional regulatory protein SAMN06264868_10299 n=1 Tax=Venenivibrio stagnispumantis TaxID=407998 RepID=A0AA45WJ99_9AQUI|nr:YebC/PmpR family DNA-binding transcriptional regulator [Venenivibrio stagnispumantis]MCW4572455.1 YebC/PmpR family DNA-binding transcriptional regulator [Venenivibrio stagnispumantis]SMP02796.1 DNA-binding regulatory protein, YebC/PmpR family [Venenivibrio stagnispumantis]
MAGHSRWHNIKNKKAKADAQRGKIFTKIIKEITVAARLGGGDPQANPRLRMAIEKAKEVNMPSENIERAIKRGTGELEGVTYEEVRYEGYGPEGVAIIVDAMTDNRNRTTAEIRHIFSKYGGNLGASGCVSFLFEDKGVIYVDKSKYNEDEIFEKAIEAGAEDVITDDQDYYEIRTSATDLYTVKENLEKAGVEIAKAELTKLPTTTVKINDEETATKLMKLLDALEDNDDVQKVYANFDIPENILEKVEG